MSMSRESFFCVCVFVMRCTREPQRVYAFARRVSAVSLMFSDRKKGEDGQLPLKNKF